MKKVKLLWNMMKYNRTLYFLAIFSIGFATIFSLMIPLIMRFTIDSVIGNKPMQVPNIISQAISILGGKTILIKNLWSCSGAIVLLTIASGIFVYLKGKWSAMASESITQNIRDKLYNHLQLLPFSYHTKVKTGDIIQRCTSDVNTIRRFLAVQLVEVGRAIFIISIVLIFMIQMSIKMTFISMAIVPIIFTFAIIFFIKIKKAFKLSDESEGRLSTVLQENLSGVRVVRAFAKQNFEIGKFEAKNREFRDLTYRLIRLLAWYYGISDFICLIQIGSVLILGSFWAARGNITLGTLLAFTSYVGMLLWPVRNMGRVLTDMGKALVSVERIHKILEEPTEKYETNPKKHNFNTDIEFNNVCFAYDKDKTVLKNISFKVKQGQTVAILGPTGSGKSSLVKLLPRLFDYQKGKISVGGKELLKIDKKVLRENIGIVLQEPFLYSRSIKNNIGIAKTDFENDDIYSAATCANVHNVILNFENGYETAVGEKGVTLSGGQKQRIAIARTLIRNNPILILDDSLSAVDTKTDAIIRKELKKRNRKSTIFIISHRLMTLAEADIIVVLDKGELIQKGTHAELIQQEGLYKKIWSIQNELEEELEMEIDSKTKLTTKKEKLDKTKVV